MKLGIFYEAQLPRPWEDDSELRMYREILDQIELADELGYDSVWFVEHKFDEEYAHSTSPEVTLAAAARNTEQIRLGHGIRLMPPKYNHPQRVAEMAGTLDIVSEGRLEFGTGESAFGIELRGYDFRAPDHRLRAQTHAAWEEATEEVIKMMTMEPYPGFEGEFFRMPARNVIPKPVQDPHPPMWVAVTNEETLKIAARMGIGALVVTEKSPEEADEWVDLYYETLKNECIPIGEEVNPNVLFVLLGFGVAHDEEEAYRRGEEAARFFAFSADHYGTSVHVPGYTNLWKEFQEVKDEVEPRRNAIGTPEQLREMFWTYADNGVDEIAMLLLAGHNEHEEICDGLEILAEEVLPEFHEKHEERQREKMEELEPYIEEAFERKPTVEPPAEEDVEPVRPLGRTFDVEEDVEDQLDPGEFMWREVWTSHFEGSEEDE